LKVPQPSTYYWYDGPNGPRGAGLSKWSNSYRIAWKRRFFSTKLNPAERKALILKLAAKAWSAESEGKQARADFYFNELKSILRESSQTDWELEGLNTGGSRAAWVEALLVAPMGGFALGKVASSGSKVPTRAGQLLEKIAQVLEAEGSSGQPWFFEALDRFCRLAAAKGGRGEAERVARAVSDRLPGSLEAQELLIRCIAESGLAEAEQTESGAADKLKACIVRLKDLQERFPDQSAVYKAIAALHLNRAVALAKDSRFADALAEAAQAETYDPALDDLAGVQAALGQGLTRLRQKMAKFIAELRSMPNAQLNAEGRMLKEQADRGSRAAEDWQTSDAAAEVATKRDAAIGRTIWRKVGLPIPAENWNSRCDMLLVALATLVARPIESANSIEPHVTQVCEAQAGWVEEDRKRIARWIAMRKFDLQEDVQPAPEAIESSNNSTAGEEDLAEWLFARKDLRLKAQVAVALLLLLTAGIWSVGESRTEARRNAAWAQMQAAIDRGNDDATIEAAEQFFAYRRPGSEPLSRAETVRSEYAGALLRWLSSEGAADGKGLARIARYRKIAAGGDSDKQLN
jgi:hypothetical protein